MILDLWVRPVEASERPVVTDLLAREWGSPHIVSRGQVHDASEAPAIGAYRDGRLVGLATYEVSGDQCELLTLNASDPRQGIGSALLKAVEENARARGCHRLWLITTNDNLGAIAFYKQRGMRLVAVHQGAVDQARKLKPSISEFAPDGTRISDELEFELDLVG